MIGQDAVEADLDRGPVGIEIRLVLMFQPGLQIGLSVGVGGAGAGQPGPKAVIDTAEAAADAADPAINAELLGPAQQVAMLPVAGQAQPLLQDHFGAKAQTAGFGFGQLRLDGQEVAGADSVGLPHGHRTKGPGAAQAGGGFLQRCRVKLRPFGIAGNGADAVFAHGLVAADRQWPEAQAGAGVEAEAGSDGLGGVVGHDLLPGGARLGVAGGAPLVDCREHRLLHHRAAGDPALGKPGRDHGARGKWRDLGPRKDKARPGLDGNGDAGDPGGRRYRRDRGGFDAIDQNMDDAGIIALGIQRAEQAAIVALCGGEVFGNVGGFGLFGRQHLRGIGQGGAQILVGPRRGQGQSVEGQAGGGNAGGG